MRGLWLAPLVVLACADSTTPNPARATIAATLSVDIRGSVNLVVAQTSDADVDVSLSGFSDGYGLFDKAIPLTAKGRIETFPESPTWQMYTARFAGKPVPGGVCGSLPVSIAMSLVRRDGNARVAGSITAYCGDARYAGIPARVLRVAGAPDVTSTR
jgi:hypothetical protein